MKIIFLGSQGSGKSTQARIIAQKLEIPQIEMGQLFRDRQNDHDEEAQAIKKALHEGVLVSDDIAVKNLKERIARDDCRDGYILDGYPRNLAQLLGLEKDIDKVFYVKISDEVGARRLMSRLRGDDTEELIKRRLEIYHKETEPLLDHFRKLGILDEVSGERSIEEIAEDIESKIQNAKK